jgi:serine/threonine protein kinase
MSDGDVGDSNMNANFQDAELAFAMRDPKPNLTADGVEPSAQVLSVCDVDMGRPLLPDEAVPSPSAHGEATPTGRSDAAALLEADITPRSEVPPPSSQINGGHLQHMRADVEPSYFSPQPRRILSSLTTSNTPTDPSPTSVYTIHGTPSSEQMVRYPPTSAAEHPDRPVFQRDLSSASTASVSTIRANSVDSLQTSTPPSKRQDGPSYPNQSYAALQTQQYHVPPILRAKSSHPAHHTGYSVSHLSTSSADLYRDIMDSGSRTVGNSPASSPGLFKTDSPPLRSAKPSDDNLYSTPWLHPAHRQAPKETHIADVDVDPVSGRKMINAYEIFDELGRGVHGKVKLGRNLETSVYVAIKIVDRFSKRRRLGKNTSHEDKIKKEIAILKKARHPNIVSLLEVIDDPTIKKVYIVLEHVARGEVAWRTEGAKEVCQVEYRRYKRESKGIFNDESAALRDEQIIRLAHQKRDRQQRRLAKTRRQRKLEFTENEPWSLELGGDSDDDYAETEGSSRASLHGDDPSSSHDNSGTGEDANMETAFRAGTPINTARPESQSVETGLEGTMYGAYDTEAIRGRTPSLAGSASPCFSDGEEEVPEHFRYVPVMTIERAREVLRDTVLGLEYLHYQNVIHRDIKPANLLQTTDCRIKISDFGVSYLGRRPTDENNGDQSESDFQDADDAVELAKTVGTPAFYAPELCNTDLEAETPQIDHKIDVWALGVTLYCLIYGRVPFHDHNQWLLMKRIAEEEPYVSKFRLKPVADESNSRPNSHGRIHHAMTSSKRSPHDLEYEEIDDDLLDLFQKLFIKNPRQRITIEGIKRHPWLTRGIENFNSWYDETNPDKSSQGGKIKISKDDIEKAVIPITILDRVKNGLRKVTEMTRSLARQGSRKRAPSTTSSNDALQAMSAHSSTSTVSQDGRRPSLGFGLPIYEALSRSRESEHPLSQSVTASPELSERLRYFESPSSRTASPAHNAEARGNPSSGLVTRPYIHDRAFSALSSAASIRTVRPNDSSSIGHPSPKIPPALPGTPTALDTPGGSNLGGIFGGLPKRAVHDARPEGKMLWPPREHVRAQSIDRLLGADDDAHTGPSLAVSTAFASGHVDQPDFLKEISPTLVRAPSPNFSDSKSPKSFEKASSRQSSISSLSSRLHKTWTNKSQDLEGVSSLEIPALPHSPARETSDERFNRAKDEFVRRRLREENIERERPRSGTFPRPCSALSQPVCPPSPDDDLVFQRQKVEDFLLQQHTPPANTSPITFSIQPRTFTSSSSEDHFATMSQSTSNPSVPSVASAGSSIAPDDCTRMTSFPSMTPAASAESFVNQFDAPSEDPAGYDGDHAMESEEDESSEEELVISLGKKGANKKRSESISNAALARSNDRDDRSARRRSIRSGSNGTVKKVPPPDVTIPSDTQQAV